MKRGRFILLSYLWRFKRCLRPSEPDALARSIAAESGQPEMIGLAMGLRAIPSLTRRVVMEPFDNE